MKLLKVVLCLVRIFQVNDLGYLKACPKVGFPLSLQHVFNFYFHFCPRNLAEKRTLTCDLRSWVLPFTLLLISIVVPTGYFMERCLCWAGKMRANLNSPTFASTWPFTFSECTPLSLGNSDHTYPQVFMNYVPVLLYPYVV